MVVERQMTARDIRQVGGDVARRDVDLSILHIFGMDKRNLVDEVQLFQENPADQAVEVTAGHQTKSRRCAHNPLPNTHPDVHLAENAERRVSAALRTAPQRPVRRIWQGLANHVPQECADEPVDPPRRRGAQVT
jgi:hypothetical protein